MGCVRGCVVVGSQGCWGVPEASWMELRGVFPVLQPPAAAASGVILMCVLTLLTQCWAGREGQQPGVMWWLAYGPGISGQTF
jgi:hypothetical protein